MWCVHQSFKRGRKAKVEKTDRRNVFVDRKQKDVRVKLLGVVFARTYRVCVGLFVYGSDFAGRERG